MQSDKWTAGWHDAQGAYEVEQAVESVVGGLLIPCIKDLEVPEHFLAVQAGSIDGAKVVRIVVSCWMEELDVRGALGLHLSPAEIRAYLESDDGLELSGHEDPREGDWSVLVIYSDDPPPDARMAEDIRVQDEVELFEERNNYST